LNREKRKLKKHKKNIKHEHIATLGILFATIIWGWAFVFSRFAIDAGITTTGLVFSRYALAATLIGIVFYKRLRENLRLAHWKAGIALGSILFLGTVCVTFGLRFTTPASTAIIICSYVMIVPIFWWVISRQKVSPVVMLACILCFCGVAVLSYDPVSSYGIGFGEAFILMASLIFAMHIVLIKKLGQGIDPISLSFMQFTVAAILGFAVFIATDRDFGSFVTLQGALSLLYLGAMSSGIGITIQIFAQKHMTSAKAGMLLSTEALFGTIASIFVGYDKLSLRLIAGALIMLFAIALPDVLKILTTRKKRGLETRN